MTTADFAARRSRFAELHASAGQSEHAVSRWMKLVENDVNNPEALNALYDLHYQARSYDKAWCVAATMV